MTKTTVKYATTLEEQMALLKHRGMVFGDEEKAKENLLDIGYYRLGFYWFPFEATFPRIERRNHQFKEGTLFEHVLQLYYFDFDLRNILLRYISRIEINFRTKLILIASNYFKENPFWYVDKHCVRQRFLESKEYGRALEDLDKETVIKRDKNKYHRKYAPAWKAIEFMSLGIVIQLFNNVQDKSGYIRSQVAKSYHISSPNQLSNYMDAVRRLRNSCAHGKVIFDYKLPGALTNAEPVRLSPSQTTNLSGTYEIFKYLLRQVSTNRVVEMRMKLKEAFGQVEAQKVMETITQNTGIDAKNL